MRKRMLVGIIIGLLCVIGFVGYKIINNTSNNEKFNNVNNTVEVSKVSSESVEKKVTKTELKEYIEKVDKNIINAEKIYNNILEIKDNKIVIEGSEEKQKIYEWDSLSSELNTLISNSSNLKDVEIVKLHNECIKNYSESMSGVVANVLALSATNVWNKDNSYVKDIIDKIDKNRKDAEDYKNIYIKNRDKILNETIYEN